MNSNLIIKEKQVLPNQTILNAREIKLNEFQVHVNNQGLSLLENA